MNKVISFKKITYASLLSIIFITFGCVQKVDVTRYSNSISEVKNPTEEQQLRAVRANPGALKYIEAPTEKVQLEAVKGNYGTIKYVIKPTEQMQLIAVKAHEKRNPLGVPFRRSAEHPITQIRNPIEAAQLIAMRAGGHLIRYIRDPSEEVQLMAVKHIHSSYLKVLIYGNKKYPPFIKNPTKKVIKAVELRFSNRYN